MSKNRFDQTLAETKTFFNRGTIVKSNRIHLEYVSKYRRVLVLADGSGFVISVSYKLVDVKPWENRYGTLSLAMAWANAQIKNREIYLGSLTIIEAPGKRII